MALYTVECILDAKARHAEGPVWDAARGVLYWVDITGCALHIYDPRTGCDRALDLGQYVCAVAPRAGGGVVAALRQEFAFVDTDTGRITPLGNPEADKPGNRFNDGKCDPAGRFWAGTCALGCDVPGAGSLYRLDPDGRISTMRERVTISNGLTWSPDGGTMYYIDTPTMEILAFDFDPRLGALANPRVVVRVPAGEGYPDGMTGDAEGMLWVAHWGGSRVCRWDPATGRCLRRLSFPAEQVSCPVFGGERLDVLYVTASRLGLSAEALARRPMAGDLFRVEPDVQGVPTHVFAG